MKITKNMDSDIIKKMNTSLNETVHYTLSINNRTHFVNDKLVKKLKSNAKVRFYVNVEK